jgi:short subunit fatty acids transporter
VIARIALRFTAAVVAAYTPPAARARTAAANLVQPFWMLPTLAILGLRTRDVMGFTFVVFLVLVPVVLVMVTVLGATLHYPL